MSQVRYWRRNVYVIVKVKRKKTALKSSEVKLDSICSTHLFFLILERNSSHHSSLGWSCVCCMFSCTVSISAAKRLTPVSCLWVVFSAGKLGSGTPAQLPVVEALGCAVCSVFPMMSRDPAWWRMPFVPLTLTLLLLCRPATCRNVLSTMWLDGARWANCRTLFKSW